MSAGPVGDGAYAALVDAVRRQIERDTPPGAKVLVVSRGDEALLRVNARQASHFPQSPTGLYAGYHPADGAAAAAHLDQLCAQGAEYLVLPATASWWLDHYEELRDRLEHGGEVVADDPAACRIYRLSRAPTDDAARLAPGELEAARTAPQVGALVDALLPDEAGLVVVGDGAEGVTTGARPCWRLPAPGAEVSVDELVQRIERARAAGARFVVLLDGDAPSVAIDGRLRRRLVTLARPVFAQRLAEAFELDSEEAGAVG